MNLETLKAKLKSNKVPESWYSLDEGLKPGALILYKNYSKWEYFYLDDRGERRGYCEFYTDEGAFDYLWEQISEMLEFISKHPPSIPPKSVFGK